MLLEEVQRKRHVLDLLRAELRSTLNHSELRTGQRLEQCNQSQAIAEISCNVPNLYAALHRVFRVL